MGKSQKRLDRVTWFYFKIGLPLFSLASVSIEFQHCGPSTQLAETRANRLASIWDYFAEVWSLLPQSVMRCLKTNSGSSFRFLLFNKDCGWRSCLLILIPAFGLKISIGGVARLGSTPRFILNDLYCSVELRFYCVNPDVISTACWRYARFKPIPIVSDHPVHHSSASYGGIPVQPILPKS